MTTAAKSFLLSEEDPELPAISASACLVRRW
jgi:hypothetical protein